MSRVLYNAPQSTCSQKVRLCLAEKGLDFEEHKLDLFSGDQLKPEYLAINPKGRVPALITEHGILTETPAVLAYIAQRYPGAGLAPLDDPFAFDKVQEFNSYLCSTVHVNHAHGGRGKRWADDPAAIEEMKRKVPETVFQAFDLIEQGMLQGPWVLGAEYSICDAYLYTVARWLERDGIDPARQLPRVTEHRTRMEQRPVVKKVIEEHFAGTS